MKLIKGENCFKILDQNENIFFYFTANWCKPCQKISHIIESFSNNYNKNDILFFKIDISDEDNKEIIDKCNIKSIPHILILKNRMEIKKFIGYDKNNLNKFLNDFL